MTDEQRKALTLYLGLYWHENASNIYHPWKCSCGEEARDSVYLENHIEDCNRTFTTDPDMMTLFRKMVDSLKFGAFQNFAYKHFNEYPNYTLTEWLFYDSERFCCLVAEWLKERRK